MGQIRFLATCMLSLIWTAGLHGQTKARQSSVLAPVISVESIQIGMPVDHVLAGLTKAGFTPREKVADSGFWAVFWKEKEVGEFIVKNGRVDSAERRIFPVKESETIDFAEALYWLLYDNSAILQSEERDWKETTTSARLDTRDVAFRTAGSGFRMIFLTLKNGAKYRINILRLNEGKNVWIDELAPFIKRK